MKTLSWKFQILLIRNVTHKDGIKLGNIPQVRAIVNSCHKKTSKVSSLGNITEVLLTIKEGNFTDVVKLIENGCTTSEHYGSSFTQNKDKVKRPQRSCTKHYSQEFHNK